MLAHAGLCACVCCAGGHYPGAFVNEFKIFVAELRDFFNAAGLTQLLDNVKGAMGPENQQVRVPGRGVASELGVVAA